MEQRIHHVRLSDGVRVGYALAGSGPPLLYLPGWVSDLELGWAFAPERRFYEALATGRTLIRYDRPGCGRSDPSDTRDLVALEMQVIGDVLDAVGAGSVDLVGALEVWSTP